MAACLALKLEFLGEGVIALDLEGQTNHSAKSHLLQSCTLALELSSSEKNTLTSCWNLMCWALSTALRFR